MLLVDGFGCLLSRHLRYKASTFSTYRSAAYTGLNGRLEQKIHQYDDTAEINFKKGFHCSRAPTFGHRTFSVAGLMAWNGLPVVLCLTSVDHSALFLSGLKTTLFDQTYGVSLDAQKTFS